MIKKNEDINATNISKDFNYLKTQIEEIKILFSKVDSAVKELSKRVKKLEENKNG